MTVTTGIKKNSGRRSKNLLRLRIRLPEIIIKLQKQQEYGNLFETLVDRLRKGIVSFVYRKKDGTERHASEHCMV